MAELHDSPVPTTASVDAGVCGSSATSWSSVAASSRIRRTHSSRIWSSAFAPTPAVIGAGGRTAKDASRSAPPPAAAMPAAAITRSADDSEPLYAAVIRVTRAPLPAR